MRPEQAPTNLLVLRHPDGVWWVGFGEFRHLAQAPTDGAFYVPDFFLTEPKPWIQPEHWLRLNQSEMESLVEEWSEQLPGSLPMVRTWVEPEFEPFAEEFHKIQMWIQNGLVDKIVPVVLARSKGVPSLREKVNWLKRMVAAAPKWLAYGGWWANEGVLGLTPEILFSLTDDFVATMALAGTAKNTDESLLASEKDLAEHDFVVRDIEKQLAKWGLVKKIPVKEWTLGAIKHLRTDLALKAQVSFEELVLSLHPTPALGTSPRGQAFALLSSLSTGNLRRRFGAPFGVREPDGSGLCAVAIRGVQWFEGHLWQGSGCGVVAQSRLEKEWNELQLKRQVVREQLDL